MTVALTSGLDRQSDSQLLSIIDGVRRAEPLFFLPPVGSDARAEVERGLREMALATLDLVKRRDFGEALSFMGSFGRMPLLYALLYHGWLTIDDARNVLSEWWASCDMPSRVGRHRLLSLLLDVGFITDTGETREELLGGVNRITVYRGCRKGGSRGVSWTRSREIAAKFPGLSLRREVPDGEVYEAEIAVGDVLGVFTERHEDEVLVNYRRLRRLTKIQRISDYGTPIRTEHSET